MSADAERRSRLLAVKLRALVRDHLGGEQPGESPQVFTPGAALFTDSRTWVLIDGDATRGLGHALAWGLRHSRPLSILVERDSGLLARRVGYFDTEIEIWHVDDRALLPAIAEGHLPRIMPSAEHLAFSSLIESAGADVVVEHGVVAGEIRGLEICRVVDDPHRGETRLEVGLGAHDREAFAMVHGDLPTEEALGRVVDAVAVHRAVGADPHPLNRFGAERLMRWHALQNPASIGFDSLVAAEPPVVRTNVKDAVPCVALGERDGVPAVAVFAHGVDLDVVPFALDAAGREGAHEAVVVLRSCDVVGVHDVMARLARLPVSVIRV